MYDFDIQHILGSENILADAPSRIYNRVKEEELTREDYLQEEQKYLNTDVFLPKESSPHMPNFSSKYNYNPYITTPVTPIGNLNPPQFVIQELRRQNTTLQSQHQLVMNELPYHLPTQTSQTLPSANANLSRSTGLPFGDGCTAAPIFWEDCNATGRCEAHLANHMISLPTGWTVSLSEYFPQIPMVPAPPQPRELPPNDSPKMPYLCGGIRTSCLPQPPCQFRPRTRTT